MARIKKIGIYLVTSPTGRKYVGQSRDIHKRFIGYKNLHGCTRQTRLLRSFEKHGVDSHEYKVLEECEITILNERERYWQDFYDVCGKNGLNCKLTKYGEVPAVITQETRLKMSEAGKIRMANISKSHLENIRKAAKKRIGTKGTPHTDEMKEANRQRNLLNNLFKGDKNPMHNSQRFGEKNPFFGKKHTNESKEKVRKARIGTKASEETLKKLSIRSSLGNNTSAKLVLDTETGIYYSCGKEAWLASNKKFVYSTFKSKLNGSNKYPLQYKYV